MAIFYISKSETGQKLLSLQSPVDLSHIASYVVKLDCTLSEIPIYLLDIFLFWLYSKI